jgi:hypothetical protein
MNRRERIPSEGLTRADLPSEDADWNVLADFALTFDGYAFWGSFAECARVANTRRHGSLDELRTCLFFAQRAWRHLGEPPDEAEMAYVRSLVRMIRDRVPG